MKNLFFLLTVLLFTNLSFAGEFEKDVDHFTTLTAAGNFKVFLQKGDKEKIKVMNNDEELQDDQIEFEVKGSELRLGVKGETFKKLNLEIHITYTKLMNISAKKGAWVETSDVLAGDEVELSCTTDGVIVAALDCEIVKASVMTSGTIRLSGKTNIGEYKVTAGGFITGLNVDAKTVVAKITTGGEISCHSTEKMDLKVTTGGTIKYKFDGDEKNLEQKVSLGGTIEKYEP